MCEQNGMKHWFIQIDGAKKHYLYNDQVNIRIKKQVHELFDHLSRNIEVALIHCAAGLHRSGFITYTLIRLNGLNSRESYEALARMRYVTYKEVGEWRI